MLRVPKTAQKYLSKIVRFYVDASFIGRPRLSGMKLEKSVAGSKASHNPHDPNMVKWERHKKTVTYKLKDICNLIDSFGAEEVSRSPRKRCKSPDHPKGKKKTFGIEFEFCPYCQARLYDS